MKKEEYVFRQAKEMRAIRKKIDRIKERSVSSPKQYEKQQSDLNFEFMYLEHCRERIGYALGILKLEDLREEYRPTSIQTYKGLREELDKLIFD